MRRTREETAERNQRLGKTKQGKALLALIRAQGGEAATADRLGVSRPTLSAWSRAGRISKSGAIAAHQLGLMKKERLRPDIKAAEWDAKPPGRPIGAEVLRDGHDQQILIALASHFGSVRKLCETAGVKVADFHGWNSRNRIAAWVIPRLCKLDIPDDLRAKLMAIPR